MAARLRDEKNGGGRIAPRDGDVKGRQHYRPDTMILETEFETGSGVVRVIDCMPPHAKFREVVRIVEGVRGTVDMMMRFIVRFDYGRTVPWAWRDAEGLNVVAGPAALNLRADVDIRGEDLSTVARFTVHEGDRKHFVLAWHLSHERPPEAVDAERALNHTDLFWREW